MTVKVFAPAKINLTLHITGQREDGYHLIDSLVGFGPAGDSLEISKSDVSSLTIEGPEAAGVPGDMKNLVMKATSLFPAAPSVAMTLVKNLPVASGIGGGSADAAAAIRGLFEILDQDDALPGLLGSEDRLLDLLEKNEDELSQTTLGIASRGMIALGADVPMCFVPNFLRASGIGGKITYLQSVPDLPGILVNPRVSVPTPAVFADLKNKENAPMPDVLPEWNSIRDFCAWLADQRNDLQEPAINLFPEIGTTLNILEKLKDALITRMSGSGATCFAAFPDALSMEDAFAKLSRDQPNWWIAKGHIGNKSKSIVPYLS